MSLDKYRMPSLGDKHREQAEQVKEIVASGVGVSDKTEDTPVEVKIKKGRRLSK